MTSAREFALLYKKADDVKQLSPDSVIANSVTANKSFHASDLNNGGAFGGMRNLLINGTFSINQRGTTSLTTSGFISDRWKYTPGAGAVETVSVINTGQYGTPIQPYHTNFLKWVRTTAPASPNNSMIEQKIEGVIPITAGKNLTISFDGCALGMSYVGLNVQLVQYISPTRTQVASGSIVLDATSKRRSVTIQPGSVFAENITDYGNACLGLRFVMHYYSGTFPQGLLIGNVQVEVGDTATPFEIRNPGYEFDLCRRYYQIVDVSRICGITYTPNGDTRSTIVFPMSMRVTPTLTQSGATSVVAVGRMNESINTSLGNITWTIGYSAAHITNISNYGAFSGCGSVISWGNRSAYYLILDAEL